jgi:hypothetical protein
MSQYSYEPNAPQKSRMDQAAEMGQQAFDQATEAATVARDTVKEHPITTLAVVGGLALAIGALWKLQRSSKTTHVDTLMERLSDLSNSSPSGGGRSLAAWPDTGLGNSRCSEFYASLLSLQ